MHILQQVKLIQRSLTSCHNLNAQKPDIALLACQGSAGRLTLCRYFFSFLTIAWSKEISETTRPIFTKFSGVVDITYWCKCSVWYWFPDWSRDVGMTTNFRREIGDTPSFLGLAFHNRWQEPLDGFAPNSHGRHAWSFACMSLNVKVKGQGCQKQKMRCALTTPRSVDGMERPRCR